MDSCDKHRNDGVGCYPIYFVNEKKYCAVQAANPLGATPSRARPTLIGNDSGDDKGGKMDGISFLRGAISPPVNLAPHQAIDTQSIADLISITGMTEVGRELICSGESKSRKENGRG